MTGDLARRLIADGLLPGYLVAVVGSGRRTGELASRLTQSGVEAIRLDTVPVEIRGEPRLEGVRVGTEWIPVDTLVLDDRLLPQAFLLRGLGLVDGSPGTPAPAAEDGRLPLPGLWAAGCCVDPDLDHERCAEAGLAAGGRAAAEAVASPGAAVRR
jgi:hypothetical protein